MPVSSLLRALDAGVVLRLLVIEDDEMVERGRSELNVDRNDPLESRNDTCAQEKVGKNASEVSALSKDVVKAGRRSTTRVGVSRGWTRWR